MYGWSGYVERADDHAADPDTVNTMVSGRRNLARTMCGNGMFVSDSTDSTSVMIAPTTVRASIRNITGATRFHAAGKPRNQLSSVIMSLRANQIADVNTSTHSTAMPKLSCGTTLNSYMKQAGTITQAT